MRSGMVKRSWTSVSYYKIVAVAFCFLVLFVPFTKVLAQPPKVADKDTKFHRVYVTGPGTSHAGGLWNDEGTLKDDRDELKNDLERAGNQKEPGSTSRNMEKPTKEELRAYLDQLKTIAEPGEEVTLYFGGHGNGGRDGGFVSAGEANETRNEWIWLNDQNGDGDVDLDETVTDDELADWLTGFRISVTIVVIMDSCFGGGFAGGQNDIQETDHVAVIGPSNVAPIDPPGIFGGLISTLTEDAADGGGEKAADSNGDGIVTADELKQWLRGRGWNLGAPNDANQTRIKNGKPKIVNYGDAPLVLPSITPSTYRPSPGSDITIDGRNFANSSTVTIDLVRADLSKLNMGDAQTTQNGSFTKIITIPLNAGSQFVLIAEDLEENLDWDIFGAVVGGFVFPVDKLVLLIPYFGLASIFLVVTTVVIISLKRVRHSKKDQQNP